MVALSAVTVGFLVLKVPCPPPMRPAHTDKANPAQTIWLLSVLLEAKLWSPRSHREQRNPSRWFSQADEEDSQDTMGDRALLK